MTMVGGGRPDLDHDLFLSGLLLLNEEVKKEFVLKIMVFFQKFGWWDSSSY